jgi:hypothetical protein
MSVAEEPPGLEDDEFGVGWSPLGEIPTSQTEVLKELRRQREGRRPSSPAVQFYLDVDDVVDHEALPERFWLGFDAVGYGSPVRVIGAKIARQGPGERRPPEAHPGLSPRPRMISLWLGSERGLMFHELA